MSAETLRVSPSVVRTAKASARNLSGRFGELADDALADGLKCILADKTLPQPGPELFIELLCPASSDGEKILEGISSAVIWKDFLRTYGAGLFVGLSKEPLLNSVRRKIKR